MLDALETLNPTQVDVPKRRPYNPDSFKRGPGQVRPAEVGRVKVRAAEVRFPEVGAYLGVLVPPLIPGFYPLLKNLDVFLIRHRRLGQSVQRFIDNGLRKIGSSLGLYVNKLL